MDYYSSSSRGRSSFRGSSYRGSRGDSGYRGSRGTRGSYASRGRGTSSYYGDRYEDSSSKYGSESKYSGPNRHEDSYHRRSESYSSRDRSDIADIGTRKRARNDSYPPSQGTFTRRVNNDDDFRGGSSRYSDSRSYEETRVFKKPRTTEFRPSRDDYASKDSIRPRTTRGRIISRGTIRRGGRESFVTRRRGSFSSASSSTTATTAEILAIRRAKLLQERKKVKSTEEKAEKKSDEADVPESGEEKKTEEAEPTEVTDEDVGVTEEGTNRFGRAFIKLCCPHCLVKCVTFKEYLLHLQQPIHVKAMKEKVDQLKSTLATMRISQREKQKAADEEDLTSMNTHSYFCAVCKLNYSQEKETHQASELHKKLKAFLSPYCRVCRVACQNPMSYEVHLCSLMHLRRKHAQEEREKRSGAKLLDEFMVLDSVGSGDEADEKETEEAETEAEPKEEDLTLGAEFIHCVKVFFCEVCRRYLPRVSDIDSVIKRHCRTKEHLRCYLHYGNETLLDKMNASNHEDDTKDGEEVSGKDGDAKESEGDLAEGDKLWDDVGELLSETQPQDKSDDEDEEEGGRFDRFKSKEKQENGDLAEAAEVEEAEEEETKAAATEEPATPAKD